MQRQNAALLIILDGFGLRDENAGNAINHARTPNWDYYTKKYAFGAVDASGPAVGLPQGQFGNSEVGHLNIGAGRVVPQDISRIDAAIADKSFFGNAALKLAFSSVAHGASVHIMGLLSDGGVHAHINHMLCLIDMALEIKPLAHIWLHIFLDGRDTPPQSAIAFLEQLNAHIANNPKIGIATCSGRYYAMDRDKHYERLQIVYDAIMWSRSATITSNMLDVVKQSYLVGVTDEFILPAIMQGYTGVHDGDSIIVANFRSDRAIQLVDAIANPEFNAFTTKKVKLACITTMTCYDPRFLVEVAFPQTIINNTLGAYLSSLGLQQLRIAETEKYPHITYFFNGGNKAASAGEDWILVDSPRSVATYDEKPEMSLPEVTQKLVAAIKAQKYDFIVTNFANGDMVGHTGNFNAAVTAVEALDTALGQVIPTMLSYGGEVLLIADHGNCEHMFDEKIHQAHTQHTNNLVPCLYVGRPARIIAGGALRDVAPTLLKIYDIPQPIEMDGHSLIEFIS